MEQRLFLEFLLNWDINGVCSTATNVGEKVKSVPENSFQNFASKNQSPVTAAETTAGTMWPKGTCAAFHSVQNPRTGD